MTFNPALFIDVAKDLNQKAKTEETYRSIVNRAYYGAFGYIKARLGFADFGTSTHQKLIDILQQSPDKNTKIIGKKLEALFLKRKMADYKYDEEVKNHSCEYCIQEAEKIIDLFNKSSKKK